MARISGVRRFSYGCCLLFGLLHQVEASSRINVNLPSTASTVASSTTSAIVDDVLSLGGAAISGTYIPGATKNTPVNGILGGIDFSMPSTALKVKDTLKASSLLKGGLASLAAGAAFDELIKGIGWVMDDGALVKPSAGTPAAGDPSTGDYAWSWNHDPTNGFPTPSAACVSHNGSTMDPYGNGAIVTFDHPQFVNEAYAYCIYTGTDNGTKYSTNGGTVYRDGTKCPTGSTLDSTSGACLASTGTTPVTDTDFDTIPAFVQSKQDAAWIKSLIQEMCANASGGSSPDSCYRDLAGKRKILTGPSSVSGGSSTSTTTTPNSDGTTSTSSVVTHTDYGLTYGTDHIDSTPVTTTTTTTNGVTTATTTQTDTTPADDSDSDSQDTATPTPCSTNCDGPEYKSLYTKTTDTKESALDSYSSRVAALPILAAATGFFTVSASGGCPTWSVNTQFEVLQAVMPIDLVFDQQCQPWFTSVAVYAKFVMSIVCAYIAFREAFLN